MQESPEIKINRYTICDRFNPRILQGSLSQTISLVVVGYSIYSENKMVNSCSGVIPTPGSKVCPPRSLGKIGAVVFIAKSALVVLSSFNTLGHSIDGVVREELSLNITELNNLLSSGNAINTGPYSLLTSHDLTNDQLVRYNQINNIIQKLTSAEIKPFIIYDKTVVDLACGEKMTATFEVVNNQVSNLYLCPYVLITKYDANSQKEFLAIMLNWVAIKYNLVSPIIPGRLDESLSDCGSDFNTINKVGCLANIAVYSKLSNYQNSCIDKFGFDNQQDECIVINNAVTRCDYYDELCDIPTSGSCEGHWKFDKDLWADAFLL